MSVRALVVDPSAATAVRLAEVPDPVPGPGEVLVAVSHASLNYGDLNDARSGRIPVGAVLGSDAAGVVVQAAADGTGPAVGARVVALTSGAFAERVAIEVGALAEVPMSLDLARAVALPVAGVAALRSLRAAGLGPDKRVLVTGASGGVGRFAVQLAARAGAHVIASVGSAARGEGLAEAGANEVLIGLDGLQRPVDVVIDSVGGPQLVAAWNLLSPGGSVQSVGWTSGEPAVFPPYATVGPAKSLTSFVIEGGVGADLAVLTELAAEGFLTVEIGWQGSWDRFDEASKALRGRRVSGKAVLAVASGELHAPVPSLQD
ncbi:zinc-binding dehydrogenase [Streptomyces sp. NBC_00201]|uniref:zinc-binding dehydrogenase n=1 Tax=unclassified Streptomyces TaxID=2593676 RepID=UPI00225A8E1A|nr:MULTISPECIES: zinc-binding dehydrogenase [unclassified Streptomyces]MCX5048842.1 zinc-binding dehydrogenase [Streptomyces sp. NBC_00474]MCX5056417.1 zinc-binding dehydrogenase [Streptomyces sp. NBC_00452]MCX5246661.1 zinc-binding dehydrogenase [Streptomyces sp. NBC_00201]